MRDKDGWVLTEATRLADRVALTSAECELFLQDVYEGVIPPSTDSAPKETTMRGAVSNVAELP